jgi:CubicO group peptidase (beta-lactamase class C family)
VKKAVHSFRWKLARIGCALHLAASIGYTAAETIKASPDVQTEARITRIENGLLEPVAVQGAPARMMRLADRMRDLHVPGVSVALIDGGRIAWARAWGVADADSGRPVTAATLFQAASISKPVAAVTTLQLAAQRLIDLDENVNRRLRQWHLPDSPLTAQRPVTARELLSHTAGLAENGLLGYAAENPCPTLLQVLRGDPPASNPEVQVEFEPGSRYAYSSLGYGVLQQYLADATGRPFDELARNTVLVPLGMHDSMFATTLPPELAMRAAVGHEMDGTPISGGWHRYPVQAAAGLWTTASDLARFAIALQAAAQGHDDGFLTQQQAQELLTPVQGQYGLGFELDHQGQEATFHHSGSNAGYKALLFAYTRTGQGAVILTNGDYGWTLIEEFMRSIAAEYGWEDWHQIERVAAHANPALYDRFTGEYAVSNTTLRITRHGGHLYASGPPLGPDAVELIPAGDYDYFIREKDAKLHFDANVSGALVQTITFVDGRPRPGKRIKDACTPAVGTSEDAARAPAPDQSGQSRHQG